jgi:CBS domain-containing protein
MITVKDMLSRKGNAAWSTTPEAKVYDALKMLAEKNVGALLVMEGDKVVGMFSERDYARKVAILGKCSLETSVKEIMASPVYGVRPETTGEECMVLMTEKKIRHLPVMDGGKLAGLVSIGDVVKSLIADHEQTIEKLQDYTMGKYL